MKTISKIDKTLESRVEKALYGDNQTRVFLDFVFGGIPSLIVIISIILFLVDSVKYFLGKQEILITLLLFFPFGFAIAGFINLYFVFSTTTNLNSKSSVLALDLSTFITILGLGLTISQGENFFYNRVLMGICFVLMMINNYRHKTRIEKLSSEVIP
jgi:hypothetical protein